MDRIWPTIMQTLISHGSNLTHNIGDIDQIWHIILRDNFHTKPSLSNVYRNICRLTVFSPVFEIMLQDDQKCVEIKCSKIIEFLWWYSQTVIQHHDSRTAKPGATPNQFTNQIRVSLRYCGYTATVWPETCGQNDQFPSIRAKNVVGRSQC